jgi:hypothetical protein
MVSAFGLLVVVLVNGERYESVPAVYASYEDCIRAEQKIREKYHETSCYKGLFRTPKKERIIF